MVQNKKSDLHSNMVRFIIVKHTRTHASVQTFTFQYGQIYYFYTSQNKNMLEIIYIPIWLDLLLSGYEEYTSEVAIYIPIWLDLLSSIKQQQRFKKCNLHSNMVRFIIQVACLNGLGLENLHSNMVRFIIMISALIFRLKYAFTFQYGQIYYLSSQFSSLYDFRIYIPIWLDLLLILLYLVRHMLCYLHSNMVRFIIMLNPFLSYSVYKFTFQYGQIYYILQRRRLQFNMPIYIPIWLDLLSNLFLVLLTILRNLHSNMVRFIIILRILIRICKNHLHSNMVRFIIKIAY